MGQQQFPMASHLRHLLYSLLAVAIASDDNKLPLIEDQQQKLGYSQQLARTTRRENKPSSRDPGCDRPNITAKPSRGGVTIGNPAAEIAATHRRFDPPTGGRNEFSALESVKKANQPCAGKCLSHGASVHCRTIYKLN